MKFIKKYKYCIALTLFISLFFSINYVFAQEHENKLTSIVFENNILTLNTLEPIIFEESRLTEPDRLIIDIKNCSAGNESFLKEFKSPLGEDISIMLLAKNKIRISFSGKASINRKSFLANEGQTLRIKIIRIGSAFEDNSLENIEIKEKEIEPGKLKEINVDHHDDETEILISTTQAVKFNTYTLKNPDRYAIDLANILPPDKPLPRFKPTPLVTGLRVGRAANGVDATRIVIDFAKPDLESSTSSTLIGNKIKIKIKAGENPDKKKKTEFKIVIDPGHGGYDTGAQYGGYDEKDITLLISEKLKKKLEEKGIKVFLTRSEDSFLSLAERVEISNSIKPHLFISIHANAIKSSRVIRGVETYYWTRQSQKLAFLIHKSILSHVSIPDHFIRKARFFVIKYSTSPAVLAELAFLSNHDDRKLLTSTSTQDQFVTALSKAILQFLDVN